MLETCVEWLGLLLFGSNVSFGRGMPQGICVYSPGNAPKYFCTRRMFVTEVRGVGQSISLKLVQNRIYIFAFLYLLDCIIWTGHYFGFEFCQICFVLFVLCVYVVCTFYSVQLADTFHRATVVEPRDRGVPNTFPSVNRIPQPESLFVNQS